MAGAPQYGETPQPPVRVPPRTFRCAESLTRVMEPKLTSPRMTSRRRLLGCALALLIAAAAGGWPSAASAGAYPNDPYFARQWNLQRLGVPAAWKTTKGKGAIIGIIDTGVDKLHL